jgi:sphingomyelin phosphodiesterase
MHYYEDFPFWDASGQLRWLIGELQDSEDKGQRVWISESCTLFRFRPFLISACAVGHIACGKADTRIAESNYMDQIFKRYRNTIAVKHYGHSHKEQFDISYTDYLNQTEENAFGISLMVGAMTPTSQCAR